jgi:NADH:ubiquinone oxidoreductase subunit 4 (subunit M)
VLETLKSIDWLGADLLTTMLLVPAAGAFVLMLISNEAKRSVRWIGILASGLTLALSVSAWTARGCRASGSATSSAWTGSRSRSSS